MFNRYTRSQLLTLFLILFIPEIGFINGRLLLSSLGFKPLLDLYGLFIEVIIFLVILYYLCKADYKIGLKLKLPLIITSVFFSLTDLYYYINIGHDYSALLTYRQINILHLTYTIFLFSQLWFIGNLLRRPLQDFKRDYASLSLFPIMFIFFMILSVFTLAVYNFALKDVYLSTLAIIDIVTEFIIFSLSILTFILAKRFDLKVLSTAWFILILSDVQSFTDVLFKGLLSNSVFEQSTSIFFALSLFYWLRMNKNRSQHYHHKDFNSINSIKTQGAIWLIFLSLLSMLSAAIFSLFWVTYDKVYLSNLVEQFIDVLVFILLVSLWAGNIFTSILFQPFLRLRSNLNKFIYRRTQLDSKPKKDLYYSCEFEDLERFINRAFDIIIFQDELDKQLVAIAAKVAHDISSPVLAIRTVAKLNSDLSDADKTALEGASIRITEIAQDLLENYKAKKMYSMPVKLANDKVLVSLYLKQIINEKKLQFNDRLITFNLNFGKDSSFAFIEINLMSFNRMMSNLLNNAVEACELKQSCSIELALDVNPGLVRIIMTDNGCGLSKEYIANILQGLPVQSTKRSGCGLGLRQALEVINSYGGKLDIDSKLNFGTKLTISFPRVSSPNWFTDRINIHSDSFLLLLHPEQSFHEFWELRLTSVKNNNQQLSIAHFYDTLSFITFANKLTDVEKSKSILISNYQLETKQTSVIELFEASKLAECLIITDNFIDKLVPDQQYSSKVSFFPRQLLSEIKIQLL